MDYPAAVSYTHLDVYKRQIIEAFNLTKLHPGIILPLYFTIAQGYMKLGNSEKALELLERYTQLATSNIYQMCIRDSLCRILNSLYSLLEAIQ